MYYKLTDQYMQTYSGFQWDLGKWYQISEEDQGGDLCSKSWFHCYSHPLLAVLLNPIHANINNPRLFEIEIAGEGKEDGLKVGFTKMRLSQEIKVPEITTKQRVKFAILCALEVYDDRDFRQWAENWLSNRDRTAEAAAEAVAEAAARAARAAAEAVAEAAARAARAAAEAAAEAARAAARTAEAVAEAATWAAAEAVAEAAAEAVARAAAEAAAEAARAAARAAAAEINLVELAEKAMK